MDDQSKFPRPGAELRPPLLDQELEIRDTFVTPFYFKTSGGRGLLKMAPQDRAAWLDEFDNASKQLDEATAHFMFDVKDWRWWGVAAWMVAYNDWKQFSPFLTARLSHPHEKELSGLFVSIAMLGCNSAIGPVSKFLDQGFRTRGWLTAAGALVELDRINGTAHSEKYLSAGGMFDQLVDAEQLSKKYDQISAPAIAPVGEVVAMLRQARQQRA